jgi:ABC-2 type transport system permease protein
MFPTIHISFLQYLTPHFWAIQGFQDVITRNLGVGAVLNEAGVLLGMAAIFFVVGVRRFRFE